MPKIASDILVFVVILPKLSVITEEVRWILIVIILNSQVIDKKIGVTLS